MEQHPVPQDIKSFQFRLVGDMTIRQFAFLGGGAVIAYIIYVLPLPVYVRYPLVLLFAGGGTATAFMPINERPLDKWVVAFFEAVFGPTRRIWIKSPEPPEFFTRSFSRYQPTRQQQAVDEGDRQKLQQYLATLPAQPTEEVDQEEKSRLSNIDLSIGGAPNYVRSNLDITDETKPSIAVQNNVPRKILHLKDISGRTRKLPQLTGIRVRKLGSSGSARSEFNLPNRPDLDVQAAVPQSNGTTAMPAQQAAQPPSTPPAQPTGDTRTKIPQTSHVQATQQTQAQQAPPRQSQPTQGRAQQSSDKQSQPSQPIAPSEEPKELFSRQEEVARRVEEEGKKFEELDQYQKQIKQLEAEKKILEEQMKEQQQRSKELQKQAAQQRQRSAEQASMQEQPDETTDQQQLASIQDEHTQVTPPTQMKPIKKLVLPTITDTPNVINGIVADQRGDLLEEAIIVIKDENGTPVRALKSNKLGQFAISTPLRPGTYQIEVEKDDYNFEPLYQEVTGSILPPLEIRSTN